MNVVILDKDGFQVKLMSGSQENIELNVPAGGSYRELPDNIPITSILLNTEMPFRLED